MKIHFLNIIKFFAPVFFASFFFLGTATVEAAISLRAAGTYTSGTASITPAIPAAQVTGDMMILIVGTKPYNGVNTISGATGWTSIGSATDGTVAAGVDVGSMKTEVFYKIATSDTETNPTVNNSSNNVSGAVVMVFQKGASEQWETPVGAGGGDASAGTGFSVTASSNPGITSGDWLVGYGAIRSDAGTQSSITVTATGLSMSAFTESPATDLATTSGGDMAMSGGYASVTSGTASAAPVYASTLAASHTGSAFITRLRVAPTRIQGTTSASNASNVIKVAINGVLDSATGSISSGTWSITPTTSPIAGQAVVVFIDGQADANESTAVVVYDGQGHITDVSLNPGALSMGSASDVVSMNFSYFDTYDCTADEDVMHSVTSSVLTVEGQGCAGSVNNSYTNNGSFALDYGNFTVGSTETLTTGNIYITANANLTSTTTATYNLSGEGTSTLFYKEVGGAFTEATSTVNIISTSGSPTLLNSAEAFHILNFNHSASVVNLGADVTITNNVGSQFKISAGVVNQEGRTITAGAASTLQIDSGATLCLGGTSGATNATCNSGATQTTAQTMPTFGTYTFDSASNVIYLSDADTTISRLGGSSYGNLKLQPVTQGTDRTYTMQAGTMSIAGDLTILPSYGGGISHFLYVNLGGSTTVTGTITINRSGNVGSQLDTLSASNHALTAGKINLQAANGGRLATNNSLVTLTGTSGTLFTNNGTFNPVGATSQWDVTSASGSPTLFSTATSLHILKINSAATVVNLGANLTLDNNPGNKLWVALGTLNTENRTITGGTNGILQLDSATVFCIGGTTGATNSTCDSGATQTTAQVMPTFSTYTFNSNSYVYYLSDADTTISATPTYGHLYLAPLLVTTSRTYTFGGAMTIGGNLNINPNESGASAPSLTVNLGGSLIISQSTATTTIEGTNSATSTLDVMPSGSAYSFATGFLVLNSGGTFDATSSTAIIDVAATTGTMITLNGGTFIAGNSSTRTLNNGTNTLNSGALTLYDFTTTGSGSKTLGGNLVINNNLAINTGTLDPYTYNLTVTGTSSITGTFNDTSATGTNLFTGAVTVNNGGTWGTNTANSAYEFRGGLAVNSTSTFTSGTGTYTFSTNAQTISGTQAFTITNLSNTVTTGAGLTIATNNLTATSLTQATNSILTISAAPTITTLDASTNTNTVIYSGTDQTIKNTTYNNLTISGSMSAVTATATVQDVFLVSGTFAPNAGTLTLSNDLTNNGTFTASGTHTVVLDTTAQADIGGSTGISFQNFSTTGIGAAKTIKFKAGLTYNFAGTFTITGTSGNLITITSDTGAAQWLADFAVAQPSSVTYANISWSGCSTSADVTLDATSVDGLNNGTCWVFPAPTIAISGTASGLDGAIARVAINGVLNDNTFTIASNAWSISPTANPSTGHSVIVFVTDGDGDIADNLEAVAVSKYDGSGDMTGMSLVPGTLSIGSANSQSVALSDIDDYTCSSDEDVMHSVSANVLNLQGCSNSYSDETLSVLASNTLTVATAETITTEKLVNAGTITVTGSPTINLDGTSGTLFSNTGTFTQATSTVNMRGNGDATVNLVATSPTFYNLTSSGTGTKTLGAGITIASGGTLTVSSGTFEPQSYTVTGAGTNTLTVSSGATLNVNASTFDGSYSSGFATKNFNSGSTVAFKYDGATTVPALAFHHLELSPAITSSRTYTLNTTAVGGNFTINPSAGSALNFLVNMGAGLTVTGDMTITRTGSATSTLDPKPPPESAEYNLTANRLTIGTGATYDATGSYAGVDITGTSGTLITNNGTWTSFGERVRLLGNGDATINSGTLPTYHFEINGTGTKTLGGTLTLGGNFTIDGGGIFDPSTYTVSMIGGTVYNTNSTIRINGTTASGSFNGNSAASRSGTTYVEYSRSGDQTVSSSSGYKFGDNLTISGSGTKTMGGSLSFNATHLQSGTLALGGTTLTLTGTGTGVLSGNGTLNGGTGTVKFTGDGAVTVPAKGYHHLELSPTITNNRIYTIDATTVTGNFTINPTAASALALTAEMGANLSVTGTTTIQGTTSGTATLDTKPASTNRDLTTGYLSIQSGGTLDATNATSTITLSGTSGTLFTLNSGTFNPGSSTVTLSGNGTATINSGTPTFYNLSLTGTGRKSAGGVLTITNDLAITNASGTLDLKGYNATVSGNVTNNGIFDAGTGYVDADVSAFLDATGITDTQISDALDSLVTNAKAHGWWAKADAIYPFIGGTADTHKYNLKDPRDADAAFRLTFSGGSHSASGYSLGAVDTDTHFVPSANFLDTSNAHMSAYVSTTPNWFYLRSADIEQNGFRLENTSIYHWDGLGGSGYGRVGTTAISTPGGFLMGSRTSNTASTIYRNGTSLGSESASNASATLSPNAVLIGGNGNTVSFVSIGEGLDAIMAVDMYEDVQAFQAELSRSVDPGVTNFGVAGAGRVDTSNTTIEVGGTSWTNTGTVRAGDSTIKLTNTSATEKTFAGGGATYNNLWLAGGAGGGDYVITGSNTFNDFKSDGSIAHTISFAAGSTQTLRTFTIAGTSGNEVTLTSTTTSPFTLVKSGAGDIESDYLAIQYSSVTPYGEWTAGTHSTDMGSNSGWIFNTRRGSRGGGSVGNAGGESAGGGAGNTGGEGTCSDGQQNGNETGIDTGGRCSTGGGGGGAGGEGQGGGGGSTGGEGTCSDGQQNGNETGIDTGGRCSTGGGGGDVGYNTSSKHLAYAAEGGTRGVGFLARLFQKLFWFL